MAYGDLANLEDVQAYLRLNPGDDVALLSRLITAASDFVHAFLNRFIPIADYEEIRNGTGGTVLVFANFPVLSVDSVTVDTLQIPRSQNAIAFGYKFDPTAITLHGWRFTRDMQNVILRYTAGYSQIPPFITQACIELVALRYREMARIGTVQQNVVGVQSDTWHIYDLLPATHLALQQFHAVACVSTFSRRLAPPSTDPTIIATLL